MPRPCTIVAETGKIGRNGPRMLISFVESDGKSINKATKRVLMVLSEFIGARSRWACPNWRAGSA